jgi:hydrogenase maturation protease
MRPQETLLAGLGSPHSDDQAGWLIIDQLAEALTGEDHVVCRKASIPLDLLDWMEHFDAVHLVDCCLGNLAEQSDAYRSKVPVVWKFLWDGDQLVAGQAVASSATMIASVLKSLRSRGSNDFALTEVLALGSQLQLLPPHITVWVITGERFEQAGEASAAVKQHVQTAALLILTSIRGQLADKAS